MNRRDLVEKLSVAGVSADHYLIGGAFDDRLCLEWDDANGTWEVFDFERGNKIQPRTFGNEDAACWYMYAKMIEWYVMTMRLVPANG